MRNLGAFFGHVARGFTQNVDRERREVSRTVEERDVRPGDESPIQPPDGAHLVLRRTTIEEIEVRRDEQPRVDDGPGSAAAQPRR